MAEDVALVRPHFERHMRNVQMQQMVAEDRGMEEESLLDYHLYMPNRLTTLADNQSKQVSLLRTSDVAVKKEYLLQGQGYYYRGKYGIIGQKLKVGIFIHFRNRKKNGLGIPLPKGVIRVYKKDRRGRAQFVGEDWIDHTPKNENIRLRLGNAFDITANRIQTGYAKRHPTRAHYNYAAKSDFAITLKNAKKEAVVVTVREPIPGDWQILHESHPHKKLAASVAEWKVTVPLEGKTTLTYSVLIKF